MSLLKVDGLTLSYGEHTVLREVSFELEPGTVCMLLGANGSGKSTLLRTLAKQHPPTSGAVTFPEELGKMSTGRDWARFVSYLPQFEQRSWPLTVAECVRLVRIPHRGEWMPFTQEDRAAIESALAATGLLDLRDRPITKLSGGEWKRTILARSLAQEARIFILDEPTAGLDLRFQLDILELLAQLAKQQEKAAILAIHDLNLASLYGDQFLLLANKGLIANGTSEDVLKPDLIQEAFRVDVEFVTHSGSKRPMVLPTRKSGPETNLADHTSSGPQKLFKNG
ncbi:MAG: ABC transporter ATP-binding protein [Planctomycetaceae bacterium]|nr:ABC transporter ATP-binding protein [Planctomycetaceae bacterium]